MENTNEMNTNEVNEQVVTNAPAPRKTGPLSPEEKAKREASRKANEEKLMTVWPEAKAKFMEKMGMTGMEMPAELEAAVTNELKKIAKAILKPESTGRSGRPKVERDAERLEQQFIKSFEFAQRNNLMEAKEGEDSIFVALLSKVLINQDLSGKIVKEAKKVNTEVAGDKSSANAAPEVQTREENFG